MLDRSRLSRVKRLPELVRPTEWTDRVERIDLPIFRFAWE